MLDEEEELDRLCPRCREEAEKARCPACGAEMDRMTGGINDTFDLERFEKLRRGTKQ